MNEAGFQELRERLQKANGLRSRVKKCKEEVITYTNIEAVCIEGSNRKEWAKKKLDYWLAELDKAKKQFAEF